MNSISPLYSFLTLYNSSCYLVWVAAQSLLKIPSEKGREQPPSLSNKSSLFIKSSLIYYTDRYSKQMNELLSYTESYFYYSHRILNYTDGYLVCMNKLLSYTDSYFYYSYQIFYYTDGYLVCMNELLFYTESYFYYPSFNSPFLN